MKLPTSPLVIVAWLQSIGLPAATTRPSDLSAWSGAGFVVVSVVGSEGRRDLDAQRRPIASLDAWAVSPGSSKPPRNQAADLLERLRSHVESFVPTQVTPGPSGVYSDALVNDAWWVTPEPREIPDPDASYAHFAADIGVGWVALP